MGWFGGDGDGDHFGDQDEDEEPYLSKNITCKHCRKSGLTWHRTKSGWMMKDFHGRLHTCLLDKKREEAKKRKEEAAKYRKQAFGEISQVMGPKSLDELNAVLMDNGQWANRKAETLFLCLQNEEFEYNDDNSLGF